MSVQETERYHFRETEMKWQKKWQETEAFSTEEDSNKPSYYVLEMFPYPSGKIHMGHVRNYTLGDVLARYKRMQGYNVLHPMGWDAFGLPAENAAIERNTHPAAWTYANIDAMREQLKSIGLSYDWSRELATCSPDYYQHEQRFFLKMREAGLAYRKESYVNWDPVDNTVLANEQVVDGRGWRSGALVERRQLSQWFLKITAFAEPLLEGLKSLEEWPEKVRIMQENWIGKSYGARVRFSISGRDENLEVYTTRPDTLFGMSFLAIAPNHPLALERAKNDAGVAEFIKSCEALGTSEETIEKAEKRGYDTGLKAIHPFTGEEKPVYIANFVLMDYGTGAIFGCPAHDQRDLEFARKYGLSVIPVVRPHDAESIEIQDEAFSDDGIAINSDFLNGLATEQAKEKAIARLEEMQIGARQTNYRLRDWGVSRQRYWGCPIPIIHCANCGEVAVPEADLPVTLPEDVTFDVAGNPLDRHPTWKHVPCPTCGKPATRETDTFDTFFESSWYFARFASPNSSLGVDKKIADAWLPVDQYIGGVEHAVLHLLYARFFMLALKHCGITDVETPFKGLMTQGMVCHQTYKDEAGHWLYPEEVMKDEAGNWVHLDHKTPVVAGRSEKMSKSKRNTVDPQHIIETYGADTARLFMLSDSPPERDLEWSDAGIDGAWRYTNRLWRLVNELGLKVQENTFPLDKIEEAAAIELRCATHKAIAAVTDDIEHFRYNKAVARIRELSNHIASLTPDTEQTSAALKEAMDVMLHLLCPMMPHLAEECWQVLGHPSALSQNPWPKAIPELLQEEKVTIGVQVNGKLRGTIEIGVDCPREEAEKLALALPNVQAFTQNLTIRKVIVVPGKIVNVVAA